MIEKMNALVAGFGSKAKKQAIEKVLRTLNAEGIAVIVLNEKYLEVEGVKYAPVVKNGGLVFKQW